MMMALLRSSVLCGYSTNFKLYSSSSRLKPNSISRCRSPPPSKLVSFTNNLDWIKTPAFRNGEGSSWKSSSMSQNDAFVDQGSSEDIQANINRMSKWVVSAIFVGVLVWKNEAESLWIAMGSVINVIICATLKRLLNQERPDPSLKSDPGMPSSHAQSIFYILMSIILSVIEKFGISEATLSMTTVTLACGLYLSWLRVLEQFHTMRQVIVGGAVGSVYSAVWFWLWHSFVFKAFISFWWVRLFVISGAASFSFAFILYVIRYWL
ncbi:lipid phosphate phosphatase epsilon 2, chloroplastic-like [Euphorbia lathyris]|uniref:lipid phosphate phosphatase epsilon 2, chloroplastic-like n=1 Tax=Euphorbia lathyris TaxID=212925 RepID=UPI0033139FD7